MILSLVAHAGGYKMMVGTHNTVDASEARGGALPYLSGMRVDGANNTVEENVGTYNTAWVLSCQRGCRVLFLQVYMVRSPVLWFDLCALPYFLRLFPGPYRAGVPGRLVPVSSDCASQRGAVSRGSAHPGRRQESELEVVFVQAFQSERPSGGGLESKKSVVPL